MHLDTEQFLELVAETSGLDKEKVEKQLAELIKEVKQAVADQEAYEIEGFGIFSGLGNRIMFIPSKELETEINFKYVGMEPIELEDDISLDMPEEDDEINPFEGLQLEEKVASTSTFEGLIEDLDELEEEIEEKTDEEDQESEEEEPGPDEWGVEAHKEDESADRLFASLMGEDYTPPITEEEGIEEKEEFDSFGDIFGEEEEEAEEGVDELDSELSSLMNDEEEEVETVSEEMLEAGLEDAVEDPFKELEQEEEIADPEDEIEELVEEIADSEEETGEETEETEEESSSDIPEEEDEQEEENLEDLLLEELNDQDGFDDPFETEAEPKEEQEIIPVITNLSSKPKGEAVAGVKEQEEEEPEKEKDKKPKKKSNQEPAPAWLWVVLVLVITGSAIFGIGYFDIITIPYITPEQSTTVTTNQNPPPAVAESTPPVTTTEDSEPVPPMEMSTPVEESVTEDPVVEEPPAEQPEQDPVTEVPVEEPEIIQTFTGEETYGLAGEPSEAGNDGYTIVIYSLSNQQNAINQHQELLNDGYRALITPIESEQYGTLWRISIGQFASLFDAAIAAEDIIDVIPDNYFIKKIN